MRSIEATGKTVNDAIKSGLEQLGVDRVDVEIQVIEMGSPGIFGMFGKRAKVKLTVKAEDPSLDIEMPVLSLDGGRSARPEKKKEKSAPRPARTDKTEKADKTEKYEKTDRTDRTDKTEKIEAEAPAEADAAMDTPEDGEKPAKKRRSRSRRRKSPGERPEVSEEAEEVAAPAPVIEREPFAATDEALLSDTAKKARDFVSGLAQRMNVPVTIECMETAEQLRMQMAGENMSLLIGRRGETQDAMQYLTSLNVNRGREEYLRVSIDTENYRAKREEALRKLAVRMAGRAKKSGKRVALEPMNPYERRILHSALQNDPDVTTHSEGEEPYRRVIITLNH